MDCLLKPSMKSLEQLFQLGCYRAYAVPARWVFSQVQDKLRIERFIVKSIRMGYLSPNNCDFEELVRGLKTVCYQWLCITSTMYFAHSSLPCWSVARGFVERNHWEREKVNAVCKCRNDTIHSFIRSFIMNIYIAPLQENYSEALPTPARSNKAVLR